MADSLIPRPTRTETTALFPSISAKELALLFQQMCSSNDERLTTAELLQIGLFRWCRSAAQLDTIDSQRAVLCQADSIKRFVIAFDQGENESVATRPTASFLVVDRRFVFTHNANKIFDLKDNKAIDGISHTALTTVLCDMGMLLMLILGKLERLRKETKDGSNREDRAGSPDRN